MAQVTLSNGLTALIDDDDSEMVSRFNWHFKDGYAVANVRRNGKRAQMRMHRFILGESAGECTDHVNQDKLDNRRANLRACSKSENGMNRAKQSNNTSGCKGVTFDPRRNRWQAQIMVKGKNHFLGRFKTVDDASDAYSEASRRLHGEYSRV